MQSTVKTDTQPMTTNATKEALLERIRQGIIGKETLIDTPFGVRRLTYADYTASGRSLQFIEDAIQQHVMPFYANTHTEANATGQQTTLYREQAREQIRQAVNAGEEDLVLFCGSGATSAVNTLITQLGLRDLALQEKHNTIIFIGPYEHHSNELPWRELGLKVIRIPEAQQGGVCLTTLENQLKEHHGKRLIGSFSAASNVTGVLCDQNAITACLHRYNALSFWDFAAAAPYIEIDMNPQQDSQLAKDALFFSTHKLIGGPGTPGILVVKRDIIKNQRPSHVGGGTVSFVTPNSHTFLPVGERREEGGTPAIIESIRAGLVFQLKQAVGVETILNKEHDWVQKIRTRWNTTSTHTSSFPTVEPLGHADAPSLSITAFRIRTEYGYLHHGFVTSLLNDLFGIQVRGGCSCAGPYGHQLLGIDESQSERIQDAMANGEKLVKPGWVRFNLNYFLEESEVDFILDAIDFIAEHGLTLLPYYAYIPKSDLWRFQGKTASAAKPLTDLLSSTFSTTPQVSTSQATSTCNNKQASMDRSSYFTAALAIVSDCQNGHYVRQQQVFNAQYKDIKTFVLADDVPLS